MSSTWRATDTLTFDSRISFAKDEYGQPAQAIVPNNSSLDVPASALTSSAVRCEPSLASAILALGRNPGPGGDIYCDTPVSAFVGTVPDADNLEVQLSPSFLNDGSSLGAESEIARLWLRSNWEVGFGTFSSTTWFTYANSKTFVDRDKSARPTAIPGQDLSPVLQILDTDSSMRQIHNDFVFQSDLDGRLQFTAGGLYWE